MSFNSNQLTFVGGDLHNERRLLPKIVATPPNSRLILHGDIIGRGSIANAIAGDYYDIRACRKTIKELEATIQQLTEQTVSIEPEVVFESFHSGMFLKYLMENNSSIKRILEKEENDGLSFLEELVNIAGGKELIALARGNGENVISDFSLKDGLAVEELVPPEERFLSKNQDSLRQLGINLIEEPTIIDDILLFPTVDGQEVPLDLEYEKVRYIISHYPPYNKGILETMFNLVGYKDNEAGFERMRKVAGVVSLCPNLRQVFAGHCHGAINPEILKNLPDAVHFVTSKVTVIRPGYPYLIPS